MAEAGVPFERFVGETIKILFFFAATVVVVVGYWSLWFPFKTAAVPISPIPISC